MHIHVSIYAARFWEFGLGIKMAGPHMQMLSVRGMFTRVSFQREFSGNWSLHIEVYIFFTLYTFNLIDSFLFVVKLSDIHCLSVYISIIYASHTWKEYSQEHEEQRNRSLT